MRGRLCRRVDLGYDSKNLTNPLCYSTAMCESEKRKNESVAEFGLEVADAAVSVASDCSAAGMAENIASVAPAVSEGFFAVAGDIIGATLGLAGDIAGGALEAVGGLLEALFGAL